MPLIPHQPEMEYADNREFDAHFAELAKKEENLLILF